jgi:hypothetical protein
MRLATVTREQVRTATWAYWHAMFTAEDTCFLCDEPVGEGRVVSLWLDPKNSAMFNAAPICAACHALPPEVKRAKELAMLRAIWPPRQVAGAEGRRPGVFAGEEVSALPPPVA